MSADPHSSETTQLPGLPPPGEPPLDPWPGRYTPLGWGTLYVRHAEGPFVDAAAGEARETGVFVHGLGGASTNWTDLMALLSGVVDGYAPDLPGFGRSDPPRDGDYSLEAATRALRSYVESLDSAPVHLFGNSLGGVVATRFAARHPHLVRSLILVSPALPSFRLPEGLSPLSLLLTLPGVAYLARGRLASVPPEQRAAGVLALCYHDPSRLAPKRREEALADMTVRSSLSWDMAAFGGAFRGLVRSYLQPPARSVWRDAAAVRAPVLLVWGRHDRLVPVALAERARRTYPGARLVVFEDSGHVSQMEKPVETAQAVLGFLREGSRD